MCSIPLIACACQGILLVAPLPCPCWVTELLSSTEREATAATDAVPDLGGSRG